MRTKKQVSHKNLGLFQQESKYEKDELDGIILTVDILTKAIKNSIDRDRMSEEAAREMAYHMMNFFGYNDRIIDNVLEPEDRDAFYMLEDSGLLTTEREETSLYDGREWRIHYWLFRKEKILKLIEEDKGDEKEVIYEGMIYEKMPDEIWCKSDIPRLDEDE
ncbi:MAG: DUF6015 family protein [Candidatus Thermoplasmatota archaeon]